MVGKRIMITLSEKSFEELENIAKERQMSKSVIISLALEKMTKEGEKREKK